jgi:hypothetical protein
MQISGVGGDSFSLKEREATSGKLMIPWVGAWRTVDITTARTFFTCTDQRRP